MTVKTMKRPTTTKNNLQAFPCVPLCPLWLKIGLALPLAVIQLNTAACTEETSANATASAAAKSETPTTLAAPEAATDNAPLPHIDSKRAFQYTREVTAFGPRYMGNENHKK